MAKTEAQEVKHAETEQGLQGSAEEPEMGRPSSPSPSGVLDSEYHHRVGGAGAFVAESVAKTEFASEKSGPSASEKPQEFTSEKSGEKSGVFASEKSKQNQRPQPVTLTVYAGEKIVRTREISPAKTAKNSLAKKRKKSGEKSRRKGRPRKNDLPDIGKYYYWKPVSDGFSLEHRPLIFDDNGNKIGQDYEYCGFLNPRDCDILRGQKDEQEIVQEIKRIIAAKRIVTLARRRSADRAARKSERA